MKKTVLIALVACMIALALGISWAGPGYGRGADEIPCNGPRWGSAYQAGNWLDLSDEQRAEIKSLRAVEREKLEPLREHLYQNRQAMQQELAKDTIDENRVRELAHAQADMKVEMQLAKRQFRSKMDSILSPEQIAQRDERRESRSDIRDSRRGHGGKGHHNGNCENCSGPLN